MCMATTTETRKSGFMARTKTDFETGDRIKFNGADSDGVLNENGHYTVCLAFSTHVVAAFEGGGPLVLLPVSGCKKRRFKS